MDIRRLLHNPEDGGWYIIGETKSEAEMNEFPMDIEEFSDFLFVPTSSGESHEPGNGIEENTEQLAYADNTQQKMNAVRRVICMLADHPDMEDKLMKDLRFLHSRI
ncbi:hypothetical protein L914_09874, partial [Phytophthora nicotianae]